MPFMEITLTHWLGMAGGGPGGRGGGGGGVGGMAEGGGATL